MSVREIALKAAEELPVLLSEEFKTADRIEAAIREAAKPLVEALVEAADLAQTDAEGGGVNWYANAEEIRRVLAAWRDGK